MVDHQVPGTHKFFVVGAAVGIVGWACILLLLGFWYLMPVNLPNVTEPLPVLNANNEIAVGDPIVLELNVTKTEELAVEGTSRWISCESGNLVTLTSSPSTLPVGAYVLISDNVTLPNKVSVGEVCTMNFRITYHINPVRNESLSLSSEQFVVIE